MEASAIASKTILEEGFAAQVLTQFSERLAALELEKELTVRIQPGRPVVVVLDVAGKVR